jgi:hypothetical protein
MRIMSSVIDITPQEREDIRLRFFREHASMPALASVGVRRSRESGAWYLDVGATGSLDVPSTFAGLQVRVRQTARAVNAVAPFQPGA